MPTAVKVTCNSLYLVNIIHRVVIVTRTYPTDKHEAIIDTENTMPQSNKASQNHHDSSRNKEKDKDTKQNTRQPLRLYCPQVCINHCDANES
jgi:hypothetical protein